MNADIRNSILSITMDDGTEILGRVESLEMTRPLYGNSLDDAYPQPISNLMVCVFDMFRVIAPKPEVPPFDLDAACNAAMARLTTAIDHDFRLLSNAVSHSFEIAQSQSAARHERHQLDHTLMQQPIWAKLLPGTQFDPYLLYMK